MISLNSKIILTVLFACVAVGQSKDCAKICTLEYNPICATNGREFRLFGNPCTFEAFECETDSVWTQVRSLALCSAEDTTDFSAGCETPCTREFRPVCGTNGERFELFSNLCLMKNAHCMDGKTWHQTRNSDCKTVTAKLSADLVNNCEKPCTFNLNPVCGFNGKHPKLFDNECIMNNEHCKDGLTWFQTRMMDCLARVQTEDNCEKACPRIYAPTCGFDGKSYQMFDNSCVMEVAACTQHATFVDAPLSACETKTIAKQNNDCIKPCPFIYAPTCGFDGKSYQMFDNSCVMEVAACNQHVTFVDAPLSACETKIVATKSNCDKACPRIYAPTCGFDGKAYQMFDNSCVMEVAACNQHVTFVDAPLSACETKTIAKQNNDCIKPCPFIYAPTCGFDGKSYQMFDNSCVMEVAACNQHVTFVDAPLSACETKTIAKQNNDCSKPCPFIYAPTCGFDGKLYQMFDNSCVMEVAACNQHVTFVDAPLSACETKIVATKNNCDKACPRIYAPTCGFDGKSYQMFDNSCVMEVAACNQHVTFVDAPLSACETKTIAKQNNDCIKACPFIYAPTCGFDGKSYQMFDNSCVMEVAACNQHVTFVDAPLSACETKTIAKQNNDCIKACPFIYAPTCGFDGKSYQMFDNSCVMEVAACNQHVTFVEQPLSACANVPLIF